MSKDPKVGRHICRTGNISESLWLEVSDSHSVKMTQKTVKARKYQQLRVNSGKIL